MDASAKSRQRAIRLAKTQMEVAVLQALPRESVGRYMVLKKRLAAYALQRWYRVQRRRPGRKLGVRSGTNDTRAHASVSNSLFVSTLPSTVDGDLSGDSHDLLLDITTTSVGNNNSIPPEPIQPKKPSNWTSRAAQTDAYKQSVAAGRLDEIHQRITARAVRRPDVSLAATGASARSVSAGPIASLNGRGRSLEFHRRMATLERLRERGDALFYWHVRGTNARGGPLALHSRRDHLCSRLTSLMSRLSNPAVPAEVLEKASAVGLAQARGEAEASPARPLSLPPPYGHALATMRWPHTMPLHAQEAAQQAHEAARESLGPGRRWWQVYHPDSGAHADIRDVASSLAWPSIECTSMTAASGDGEALTRGVAGWESCYNNKRYLPAHAVETAPMLVLGPDPRDAVAVATDGLLDLGPSLFQAVNGVGVGVGVRARHRFAGYDGGYDAGVNERHTRTGSRPCARDVTDGEASDLWLAYCCSPLPLFSQVDVERAVGLDAPQKVAVGSRLLASLKSHVVSGQGLGTQATYSGLDATLAGAARALGVIDPWCTAAAYMDPSVVSEAVRDASAAAARLEIPHAMDQGSSTEPSVDDLLNMTAALAMSAPFDFYASVRGAVEQEARITEIRQAGRRGKKGWEGEREEDVRGGGEACGGLGLGVALELPSLAAPGDSIGRRVKVAYEALKRRVESDDAMDMYGVGPVPGGSPGHHQHGNTFIVSSSMRGMARDVSARAIQHAWRGRRAIARAQYDADRRRAGRGQMGIEKASAVKAAVVRLVSLLESTTGMDMGALSIAPGGALSPRFSSPRSASGTVRSRPATALTPSPAGFGSGKGMDAAPPTPLPPQGSTQGSYLQYRERGAEHGRDRVKGPDRGLPTVSVSVGGADAEYRAPLSSSSRFLPMSHQGHERPIADMSGMSGATFDSPAMSKGVGGSFIMLQDTGKRTA